MLHTTPLCHTMAWAHLHCCVELNELSVLFCRLFITGPAVQACSREFLSLPQATPLTKSQETTGTLLDGHRVLSMRQPKQKSNYFKSLRTLTGTPQDAAKKNENNLDKPPPPKYRANPNYLRNPKFCVGCFEFYLSKILRQHLKQGEKKNFAIFFCRTHFCEGPGVP